MSPSSAIDPAWYDDVFLGNLFPYVKHEGLCPAPVRRQCPFAAVHGTLRGMTDIKSLLPHRDPFLFVDRIEKADAEEVVAYRRFTKAEPFFAGHFPQYPVVPGVILVETLAQCGGAGLRMASGGTGMFFLAAI
jgi:FabA-like domain